MVGKTISHYQILEKLGEGGMGVVYKARDTRLGRSVAMKFVNAEFTQRFEREARAISALNHPHICTLYDVGEHGGSPYLVMEYVEGKPLKGPLPVRDALRYAIQTAEALAAAHKAGIVHRDLKPGNVLVTADGRTKVLDFGLAKLTKPTSASSDESTQTEQPSTETGLIVGTVSYMSPEQAEGKKVDARSDIFSFGSVLYEMLTGRRPFRRDTPALTLAAILHMEPPPLPAEIPADLVKLIARCQRKEPERRYQHMDDVKVALEELEEGSGSRFRWPTRRWTLALAGGGAASLAAGGFLVRRLLSPPDRRIMVAVLPFENTGGNPQEAFLSEGLHQDMISVLSRLYPDRLGVIARTSVRRYLAAGATIAQIGRELRVDYVVEGGVQREGSQARVTARLIRVRDQTQLWNATYDRDLSRVLPAQAEMAQAIARGIERRLRPDARVSSAMVQALSSEAVEAYLRGQYARAVELEPHYAAAFSGLAAQSYYPGLFGFREPRLAFGDMQAAARALEIDPTQAGAHASFALSKLHLQWSWSEAEEGLRQALRLDPSNAEAHHMLGHLLLWAGRLQESARQCRRGLEVDPYNPDFVACIGWHELCAGNNEAALDAVRRAMALQTDHGWALLTMGWIYERKGMYEEALSALRKTFNSTLKTASLAHAFARSGNRATAEKITADLLTESEKKYVSAYDIAVAYSGLGDLERTFQWLDRAFEEHAGFLLFLGSDPRFEGLRRHPQFQNLRRRTGVSSTVA